MNIAVLGGTFDPPHFGHLLVARQVMEKMPEIKEVWFLPANTNPDKTVFASAEDRLSMVHFLTEPGIRVSDLDINRGGVTYTIDTVRELVRDGKNHYHWIIGSDLVNSIKNWEGYGEFIRLMPFLVFPRPEYRADAINPPFRALPKNNDLLMVNYSSTVIRQRVSRGLSITGLVPDKVVNYINKNSLYKQKRVYV